MIKIQQNDFNAMQAQAIKYARELQQRATPQSDPEPHVQSASPPPKPSFPEPEKIFGHRNPWTQKRETPFCRSACPIKKLIGNDGQQTCGNDMLLLMALLLVLTADGGDRILILALLYIMT